MRGPRRALGDGVSRGDFHTHSTRSDGTLAPAELVRLAWRNGVRVLALTDHDTLDGIAEARAAARELPGMRLVPGVELSEVASEFLARARKLVVHAIREGGGDLVLQDL